MNPHPSLLIFVPLFLIEMLLMVYFPVWGVIPPFTLTALVLMFPNMTTYRIARVCLVLGVLGELLIAVDRGSYLLGFAAVGAVLVAIKTWYKQEPYSWKALLIFTVLVVGAFEIVVVMLSPERVVLDWLQYMRTELLVGVGLLLTIIFVERMVRKVI